jgi:CHASE2 domain-containing sensor protein
MNRSRRSILRRRTSSNGLLTDSNTDPLLKETSYSFGSSHTSDDSGYASDSATVPSLTISAEAISKALEAIQETSSLGKSSAGLQTYTETNEESAISGHTMTRWVSMLRTAIVAILLDPSYSWIIGCILLSAEAMLDAVIIQRVPCKLNSYQPHLIISV